jgi:uncharacterized protein DUF2442
LIKITRVEHLRDRILRLTFNDGTVGDYDLNAVIDRDAPMVEPLKDPAYFARVFLEMGALAWPNGLELSPSAIHRRLAEAGGFTAAGSCRRLIAAELPHCCTPARARLVLRSGPSPGASLDSFCGSE